MYKLIIISKIIQANKTKWSTAISTDVFLPEEIYTDGSKMHTNMFILFFNRNRLITVYSILNLKIFTCIKCPLHGL